MRYVFPIVTQGRHATTPLNDQTLMMVPRPRERMPGRAARIVLATPKTFVSNSLTCANSPTVQGPVRVPLELTRIARASMDGWR